MTTPNPGEELPSTDQASLDRLKRFGGGKLLHEMVKLFVEAAPERIAAAKAALASNDVKGVEEALHSLKSSSAQLGAMKMQRLCEAGETTARAGSLTNVDVLVQQLEVEFPSIKTWLENACSPETT